MKKKRRMIKRKTVHRISAALLCILIIAGLTSPEVTASPAFRTVLRAEAAVVQSAPAIPASRAAGRTEAAVMSAVMRNPSAESSLVLSESEQMIERASADRTIWDKIKEKLPKIDFSEFDQDTEKEKLREAIKKMDELGISPEKLADRAWSFLNRKENKEKIDHAMDELRDKTGKAKEKIEKEVTDRASQAVDEAADKAEEEIKKKAAEEVEEAKDRVSR